MDFYWDISAGRERMSSKENYIKILKCYCKESVEAKKVLKLSLLNKDYDRYRVQIHSLKSNSLEIGAKELSELAKKLEFSIKDKNYEFVNKNADIFLESYDTLLEEIYSYLHREDTEEKKISVDKEISKEEVEEIVGRALKYLEDFEADMAAEALEKIKFIEYISKCIEFIDDFDYEEAKKMLKDFRG